MLWYVAQLFGWKDLFVYIVSEVSVHSQLGYYLQLIIWGPHTYKQCALCNLLTRILIIARTALIGKPKLMFDQKFRHPLEQTQWHLSSRSAVRITLVKRSIAKKELYKQCYSLPVAGTCIITDRSQGTHFGGQGKIFSTSLDSYLRRADLKFLFFKCEEIQP